MPIMDFSAIADAAVIHPGGARCLSVGPATETPRRWARWHWTAPDMGQPDTIRIRHANSRPRGNKTRARAERSHTGRGPLLPALHAKSGNDAAAARLDAPLGEDADVPHGSGPCPACFTALFGVHARPRRRFGEMTEMGRKWFGGRTPFAIARSSVTLRTLWSSWIGSPARHPTRRLCPAGGLPAVPDRHVQGMAEACKRALTRPALILSVSRAGCRAVTRMQACGDDISRPGGSQLSDRFVAVARIVSTTRPPLNGWWPCAADRMIDKHR